MNVTSGLTMEGPTHDTMWPFSEPDLWHNLSSLLTLVNSSVAHIPVIHPEVHKVISVGMIVFLFISMLSVGCTMELSKIKDHIVKPKGVAIAVVAQYGVMPLTAFSLAKLFQLGPIEAVTVLVSGCCPGGNFSNILALALQGDMNLSIVMTTCSTVLALGMMPLLLYLYCQGFSNLENAVPFTGILLTLVMTLVPCGIGVFINYYRPQYSRNITRVGIPIVLVATIVIVVTLAISSGRTVMAALTPPLVATAVLMPLIGYSFGYILSSLFRLNRPGRRTIAMETGCQNNQLCFSILKVAFPQDVIGTLYLFPAVYFVFQLSEALLLILLFRCHQRFRASHKDTPVHQSVISPLLEAKETAHTAY